MVPRLMKRDDMVESTTCSLKVIFSRNYA